MAQHHILRKILYYSSIGKHDYIIHHYIRHYLIFMFKYSMNIVHVIKNTQAPHNTFSV